MEKHEIIIALEDGSTKIGVVGLGYVGLPLALSFSRKYKVVGFDTNVNKIEKLNHGQDYTGEIEDPSVLKNDNIFFTSEYSELIQCSVIIIAVPTPVNIGNKPDLEYLLLACKIVGKVLQTTNEKRYICFESTVYPGCTEEDCLPVIEKISSKQYGKDFHLGYSPERINPGDKKHKFENIVKVVSGCSQNSKELFAQLYGSVVEAGIHIAPSIKVAEAAKIIENTQRDINIALINELSVIFSKLKIDTSDVLAAASTKWNFLNFVPGLVGGHCIGVDPYYLTYKSETLGYIPKVILSGRAINDSMGGFVASEAVKLTLKNKPINGEFYKSLILGFTFKENVSDVRNTKIIDIINTLKDFNFHVDVIDPIADKEEAISEYGIELSSLKTDFIDYDVIFLAVPHDEFSSTIENIISLKDRLAHNIVLIDIKSKLKREQINMLSSYITYWRL
ncbi:nucleotide sugar dehydrogenase [Silvanigrella paludirubra]|uniref:Nucleotide sugar dehydrogenase n=1 Tax=Silvanigrella paludirubra TaxID=2499159 RepID=A0A6N6VQ76_9BACT|nr:nucleotide sugar dehydrogenase [Silvanigrella paludirubra]KAB8036837.1 nucleotide sugar dehydrogenase [Silvanigrella paludirubra]